jgi:hypothetical protein
MADERRIPVLDLGANQAIARHRAGQDGARPIAAAELVDIPRLLNEIVRRLGDSG